jgi:hypothetical protein
MPTSACQLASTYAYGLRIIQSANSRQKRFGRVALSRDGVLRIADLPGKNRKGPNIIGRRRHGAALGCRPSDQQSALAEPATAVTMSLDR